MAHSIPVHHPPLRVTGGLAQLHQRQWEAVPWHQLDSDAVVCAKHPLITQAEAFPTSKFPWDQWKRFPASSMRQKPNDPTSVYKHRPWTWPIPPICRKIGLLLPWGMRLWRVKWRVNICPQKPEESFCHVSSGTGQQVQALISGWRGLMEGKPWKCRIHTPGDVFGCSSRSTGVWPFPVVVFCMVQNLSLFWTNSGKQNCVCRRSCDGAFLFGQMCTHH